MITVGASTAVEPTVVCLAMRAAPLAQVVRMKQGTVPIRRLRLKAYA